MEHWEVLAALKFFGKEKKQNPSQLIIIISLGIINRHLQKSHRTGKRGTF